MEAVAAAVYLFDLTGETVYRDYIDTHYRENHIFTNDQTLDFDYTQTAPLVYYACLAGATPSVSSAIKVAFAKGFEDGGWKAAESDPYRAHISPTTGGVTRPNPTTATSSATKRFMVWAATAQPMQ